MKAIITSLSPKNKGIKLKTDKGDNWFDVPDNLTDIFTVVKIGEEIDFTYNKNEKGKYEIKTLDIKSIPNIPKTNNNDYSKKQDNITKLALFNTATAIYGDFGKIEYEDYQNQMHEKAKRIVNIAKYLWGEMEKDWNERDNL